MLNDECSIVKLIILVIMYVYKYTCIAFHEAGHAVAGWNLEYADPLLKVRIYTYYVHSTVQDIVTFYLHHTCYICYA